MDSKPQDRRRFPRFTALRREVQLGWWAGTRFRSSRAHLVNISPSGTLIEVDSVPPDRGPVWVGPGEGSGAGAGSVWWEATIVAQAPARALQGGKRLRLEFVADEGQALFEAATRAEESDPAAWKSVSTLRNQSVPAPLIRLGLSWPTTTEAVHNAYRQLAKRLHPDHGGSTTAFLELRENYEMALALCLQAAKTATSTAPFTS